MFAVPLRLGAARIGDRLIATSGEFARHLRTETVGVVLPGAAAAAVLWASSPWSEAYRIMGETVVGPAHTPRPDARAVGRRRAADDLLRRRGLELKRELVTGELSARQALLPVAAALGGMIVPAGLALPVGCGAPGMGQAWAIPVATDIGSPSSPSFSVPG